MKNSSFGKKENPLNTVVLAYFHYRHEAELAQGYLDESGAVSYTHLTLPTIYSV